MRSLVIGYGNPSRRDDGVALAVVNELRSRLGLAVLDEGSDGFDDLGHELDTLFLQQLNPELSETLSAYERVVFVDAHVSAPGAGALRRVPIEVDAGAGPVSHHFRPSRLLALASVLYGRTPEAELLSIEGHDFDFGTELSPATAEAARQAVDVLWAGYAPQGG